MSRSLVVPGSARVVLASLVSWCAACDGGGTDPKGDGVKLLDQGDCTIGPELQPAIDQAVGGEVFDLCAGHHSVELVIGVDVTIRGAGSDSTTLSGDEVALETGDEHTAIQVVGGAAVTLEGLTISRGMESARGGGIVAAEAGWLVLRKVVVSGNEGAEGGGIVGPSTGGTLELIDTVVSGNRSLGDGGGIVAQNLTLTRSRIEGNAAAADGGGVVVLEDGEVTLDAESEVFDNEAARGGGVVLRAGAGWSGGAIRGNRAAEAAGVALDGVDGQLLGGVRIADNTADTDGGGLGVLSSGDLGAARLESVTIEGNTAGERGGGIAWSGSGGLQLAASAIRGNAALGGGGVAISTAGLPVELDGATELVDNFAEVGGGALVIDGGLVLSGTVARNAADRFGGGVRLEAGRVVSEGASWGEGADANTPDALSFGDQGFELGGQLDFTCDSEQGCAPQ